MAKKIRIWWKPQIQMEKKFVTYVNSIKEAKLLIDTLANYDLFQYENKIKPDYANIGGIEEYVWGEWTDVED